MFIDDLKTYLIAQGVIDSTCFLEYYKEEGNPLTCISEYDSDNLNGRFFQVLRVDDSIKDAKAYLDDIHAVLFPPYPCNRQTLTIGDYPAYFEPINRPTWFKKNEDSNLHYVSFNIKVTTQNA